MKFLLNIKNQNRNITMEFMMSNLCSNFVNKYYTYRYFIKFSYDDICDQNMWHEPSYNHSQVFFATKQNHFILTIHSKWDHCFLRAKKQMDKATNRQRDRWTNKQKIIFYYIQIFFARFVPYKVQKLFVTNMVFKIANFVFS